MDNRPERPLSITPCYPKSGSIFQGAVSPASFAISASETFCLTAMKLSGVTEMLSMPHSVGAGIRRCAEFGL